MGERKFKGYAARMFNHATPGQIYWVGHRTSPVADKSSRRIFKSYFEAMCGAVGTLNSAPANYAYRTRIVAIYSKPKRTAAEERARVVEYLRSGRLELTALEIEEGAHWKADVQKPHVDTDAPQLEALGKAK